MKPPEFAPKTPVERQAWVETAARPMVPKLAALPRIGAFVDSQKRPERSICTFEERKWISKRMNFYKQRLSHLLCLYSINNTEAHQKENLAAWHLSCWNYVLARWYQ